MSITTQIKGRKFARFVQIGLDRSEPLVEWLIRLQYQQMKVVY